MLISSIVKVPQRRKARGMVMNHHVASHNDSDNSKHNQVPVMQIAHPRKPIS